MGGICCRACAKPAPAESLHGERQGQVPCAGRALALGDILGMAARGADMQQAVPSCAGRGIGHGWCTGGRLVPSSVLSSGRNAAHFCTTRGGHLGS